MSYISLKISRPWIYQAQFQNMPKIQIRKIQGHLPRAIIFSLQAPRIEKGEVRYFEEGFPETVSSVLRFVDITVEIIRRLAIRQQEMINTKGNH